MTATGRRSSPATVWSARWATAVGALAAGGLEWLDRLVPPGTATQAMFLVYAAIGVATWWLYSGLPDVRPPAEHRTVRLGPSRRRVYGLAALFSVDSFGGGFVVNSMLALWLFERFGLSIATTGSIFFATGLCSAVSYLVAVPLSRRFGLINTMVFTHLPSSVLLILAALAPDLPLAVGFLVVRSLLSQMDVPTRSSYVMAIVEPAERPAAASLTAVPRSLAAALSPALAGWMLGRHGLRLAADLRRGAEDRLRSGASPAVPRGAAAGGGRWRRIDGKPKPGLPLRTLLDDYLMRPQAILPAPPPSGLGSSE